MAVRVRTGEKGKEIKGEGESVWWRGRKCVVFFIPVYVFQVFLFFKSRFFYRIEKLKCMTNGN